MPRKYIPYLHDAFSPAVFTDHCHKSLTYYSFTKGQDCYLNGDRDDYNTAKQSRRNETKRQEKINTKNFDR